MRSQILSGLVAAALIGAAVFWSPAADVRAETDQIDKLQKAGMIVTRPDLSLFRARMEPAYKRIAAYAGEENVKKFRAIVDQTRKG